MLIHFQAAFVFCILVSCLTSAFSTRFLVEGVDEEGKPPVAREIKTLKTVKKEATEKKDQIGDIQMEVIPLVTDMLTQPEDLLNMTPLKLVTAIAAQHLITTVKNIPVAGNSYTASLDMLESIVKEFNKTADIINLTAKYVNISGHYILSILKEFTDDSCDVKSLDEAMRTVRTSFLNTITDHVVAAVKGLNEKTRHREMSGSDILISSSSHIVAAFQEMTNQVLTLGEENRQKCEKTVANLSLSSPSEHEQNSVPEQKTNNIFSFQPIPQQGKHHKSIKKDQVQPKIADKNTKTKFSKLLDQTVERFANQDLTIEVFPQETILAVDNNRSSKQKSDRNQFKIPELLVVENDNSFNNKPLQTNSESDALTTKEHVPQRVLTRNPFSKFENVPAGFNNQDLTIEIFSPNKIQQLDQKMENKIKGMQNNPIKREYLFNSKNGLLSDKSKENLNKLLFTDQSFVGGNTKSAKPQLLLSQKGDMGKLNVPDDLDLTLEYIPPQKLSIFEPPKSDLLFDTPRTVKTSKVIDKELDSSIVDSLSNIPWSTLDEESKDSKKDQLLNTKSSHSSISDSEVVDLLQSPLHNTKSSQCDDHLEPVCGFDGQSKKLIIFLNNCRLENHNTIHKTNYSLVGMDNCVGYLLGSSALQPRPRRINLLPR